MLLSSVRGAQVQGLSATRRAAQLNSVNKVQHQPREGPSEVSMPGPIPAPDSQGPRLTPPPWGELSAARILASMDIKLQPLLDRYVSMTYLARAQTVNTNIAKHCACSLPGGGAHPRLAELALPERYIQDSGLRHAVESPAHPGLLPRACCDPQGSVNSSPPATRLQWISKGPG